MENFIFCAAVNLVEQLFKDQTKFKISDKDTTIT